HAHRRRTLAGRHSTDARPCRSYSLKPKPFRRIQLKPRPWIGYICRSFIFGHPRTTTMTRLQNEPKIAPSPAKPRFKGKSGAQILHEMLVNDHKVEYMFGYPGGAILPMFDQLYKTPAKFILNRHEQASGHCADGYARATGRPGV